MKNTQDDWTGYVPPAPSISYQVEPVRDGTTVPFLQALGTGVLTFFAVLSTVWMINILWHAAWPMLPIAVFFSTVAALFGFLGYRVHWAWMFERLLGVDLDRDAFRGPPPGQSILEPPPRRIQIELGKIEKEGNRVLDRLELDPQRIPEYKLAPLARRLLGPPRATFAHDALVGADVITSDEFRYLRDEFEARGWLRWRDPLKRKKGMELTAEGLAVLQELARLEPSAPPPPYSVW